MCRYFCKNVDKLIEMTTSLPKKRGVSRKLQKCSLRKGYISVKEIELRVKNELFLKNTTDKRIFYRIVLLELGRIL